MDLKKLKPIAASWLRASLASVAALYLSGVTDTKTLLNGFIAGLLGPAIKYLDPNETTYGVGSK